MNTTPTPHPRRLGQRVASLARALPAALTLAALVLPSRSHAQVPTFNTVVMSGTGSEPWNPPQPAAVGDFNGDGKLDALIVDGSARARFMRGNGTASLSEINIDAVPMSTDNMVNLPAGLAQYLPKGIDGYVLNKAADVNGDGKLDVICVTTVHINFGPYSLVTVLTNTGNDANGVSQFSTTYYFLGFYDVRSLAVGDLNGDGKPDIIIGSAYGGLYIYRNNGNGTFTPGQVTNIIPIAGGPAVGQGVIADVNGDGKADFVVTSGQSNSTNVFLGNGDCTLQAPTIVSAAASCIAIADLNQDGKPDLIEGLIDGSVAVYPGNGNGTFGSPTSFPSGAASWPRGFFISDVNGDGNLDVAVGLPSIAKVAILTGNGNGVLGSPILYGNVPTIQDVILADFTGDGKPEIAAVSANGYGGQNFAVFANTTVFAQPATQFFTDALGTSSTSPNVSIPAGKYAKTAAGLQRTQSDGSTDRPIVATRLASYLTASNFTAEVTVTLANNDILYFGLGQGDADPLYFNEPSHAFYFRVHNNWGGNSSIQGDVRGIEPGGVFVVNDERVFGNYTPGSSITLRIVRTGDSVKMSVVGGASVTYSLAAFPSLGLTNANTRVFLGNTTAGSVFSNLNIYENPSDTTAPVISSPGDITREATSAAGAVVNFTATATDAVDGAVSIVASPASGSTFAIGTTPVGLAAADRAGNTATASFNVLVRDTTKPVVTVPTAIAVEATSAAGAVVTYPAATATDAVGVTSLTSVPASGSTFALGTTTVNVAAKDAAGNSGTGSFTVTVRDTTPPVIATTSANLTAEATSSAGATVSYAAATATDLVGPVTLSYSKASGSTFSLGATTVTVNATDAANNAAVAKTFTVTVVDTTAPAITVPANVTVEATGATGAVVNYLAATATDAVGVTSLTYSQASGTLFPIGTTTVTVTAKDAVGNTSTKSFTVTVKDTTAPAVTATLTPRGGGDDESSQFFTIAFTATDLVGVKTLTAVLNGVTVTNGQVVQLQTIKSGAQSVKRDDGKLQIKATTFSLVVTATDAAGNKSTKTVVPVFVKNGKDDEDKKSDEKKDDDKKSDDKKEDSKEGSGKDK